MKTYLKHCQWVLLLLVGLATPCAEAAEKYSLKEKFAVADQWRTNLSLQLSGNLQMRSGDKVLALTLAAQADHQFPERVLNVDEAGQATRVARSYEQAKAGITVQGSRSERSLRPERRLQVAQRIKDETVTFAPSGPLTREELELTGEHLDVLMAGALLPEKEVGVGEAWEVTIPAIQALVGLDGVISQDVKGKLESVQGDMARITFSGNVEGISRGAELKTAIDATASFDLKAARLTALEWKQKEQREQGPVTPAAKTESTTTMKRTLGVKADALSNGVVAQLPAEPGPAHLMLLYRDAKGRFEFLHERAWHVVAQNDQYTVMRMLERGELVAQVNVLPWAKARPGQHIGTDELKKLIEESPAFTVDQTLQSGTMPAEAGYWIYRVSAVGKSNETPVLQNYYAVAGPQGDQLMLVFTTEVNQAEHLGSRDLSMVGTVSFAPTK
jgi:hypothetical protein